MKKESEKNSTKKDYWIVIVTNFHVYTDYFDTWDDAVKSFSILKKRIAQNKHTFIREIILLFQDDIKAFYSPV